MRCPQKYVVNAFGRLAESCFEDEDGGGKKEFVPAWARNLWAAAA